MFEGLYIIRFTWPFIPNLKIRFFFCLVLLKLCPLPRLTYPELLQVLQPPCKAECHRTLTRSPKQDICTLLTPTHAFFFFLALAQWAAGHGSWYSVTAHTLDIYKTTNHWNHRNAVFHFLCQASCRADHTAASPVVQHSPSLLFLWHLPSRPQPLFSRHPLFPLIHLFILAPSWFLQLSHLHFSILSLSQLNCSAVI